MNSIAQSTDSKMTKAERTELAQLVKLRAKLAKDDIEARSAWLLADVETKLSAIYPSNHPSWAEITEEAKKFIKDADEKIARLCREQGIPEEFRPGLNVHWYGRGENAMASRRSELRKAAQTRIAAQAKAAKVEVDRSAEKIRTNLVLGALESDEAKAFISSMPSANDLMPQLTMDEIKALQLEVNKS